MLNNKKKKKNDLIGSLWEMNNKINIANKWNENKPYTLNIKSPKIFQLFYNP